MWGGGEGGRGVDKLISIAAAEAGAEAGAEAETEAGAAVGGVRGIVLKAKSTTTTTTKLNRTHRGECSRRDELGGIDGDGRDPCRDVRAE